MLTRNARGQSELGGAVLDDLFLDSGLTTPAYVYDLDGIASGARALIEAFGAAPHLVAYAIKACSAGPIIRTLAAAGCGMEVVSGAELEVATRCGLAPDQILYSGVAKLDREIDAAIGAGERGILAIQVESVEELARVEARAKALGRRARVSLRVNPGVEADTHAHVATGHDEAKFGIAVEDASAAWDALARAERLDLVGLSCHIGSQLTDTREYLDAAAKLVALAKAREASVPGLPPLQFLDFGGGFGVDYGSGCPTRPSDFARAALDLLQREGWSGRKITVEPGRALVAEHGVLCASVIMTKRSRTGRKWLMIDAGMNDLIRPALYAARHRIEPLDRAASPAAEAYRVVGPVCESSDDFGDHPFDFPPPARVVIRDAGAYGFTMASEYNGRALPAEIFLSGGRVAARIESPGTESWISRRLGAR